MKLSKEELKNKIVEVVSDEDTQKELEAILKDEKDNNPLSNMNFDYGKEEDEE